MSALLQSEHWVSKHVKQELEELPELHSFAQNRRPQSTCVPRQEAQVDGTFKAIRQSETHAAFVSFSEHCCAHVCKLFWLSDRQLPSAIGRLANTTTKTRPNVMARVRSWDDNLLELGNNCTQADRPSRLSRRNALPVKKLLPQQDFQLQARMYPVCKQQSLRVPF